MKPPRHYTSAAAFRAALEAQLQTIAKAEDIDRQKLNEAVSLTFNRRGTHDLPPEPPQPPEIWQRHYARLADECGLNWSMEESVQAVAELLRGSK